jgi:hypothetical protein
VPAKTAKQQRAMGADLNRVRSGKKSRLGMTESQLEDFARKPKRKPKGYGR